MRLLVRVTGPDGELLAASGTIIDTDENGRVLENDVMLVVPESGEEIHVEVIA